MTRYFGLEGIGTLQNISPTSGNPFPFKNSLWLVGYWEDFSVSYSTSEATSNELKHTETHFGNPMNSEARLNPYYRWSFPDRKNVFSSATVTLADTTTTTVARGDMNGLVTSDIKRLHNLGAFEHCSIDTMRLGKGVRYAGILNNEYIDSNSNSNRYKYGGLSYEAVVGSINAGIEYESYIMFNPSYSDAGRYLASSGNTDITNGRQSIHQHSIDNSEARTAADLLIIAEAGNYSQGLGAAALPHNHGQASVLPSYLISSTVGANASTNGATPITGVKKVMFNTMISTAGRFNFTSVLDTYYGGASDPIVQTATAWARGGDGRAKVISADIKSPSKKPFLVIQSTFPAQQVIEGQVFNGAMGASFASTNIGGIAGQWTTGDLAWAAPNNTTPTGTDYREYTDLREGDIVIAPTGWCIVQKTYHDDKSLLLYNLATSALLDFNRFDPAHASYIGAPAALNRVPLARKYWPITNYNGPLNASADGDTFHMRICPQHLNDNGLPNTERSLHYVFKVGYDKDQITWTENGNRYKQSGLNIMPTHFNACVEIDLELGTMLASKSNDPNDLGTHTGAPQRHEFYSTWNASNTASFPQHAEAYVDWDSTGVLTGPNYVSTHNQWIDLDIVFDFSGQQYELYINGKRTTAGKKAMLAKPDGTAWVASDLYGWHIDAVSFLTSFGTQTNSYEAGQNWDKSEPQYLATLIDRVGIIHELTNPVNDIGGSGSTASVHTTKNTLLIRTDLQLALDKTGMLQATVSDDDNNLHLQRIIKDTTTDWKVMLFNEDIDDFLWLGSIGTLVVTQNSKSKGKEITLTGEDAMNSLERIMPYWEAGQTAYGPSTTYAYRRQESEMAQENFYFGTRRLLRSNAGLGFDHQTRTVSRFDDATEIGAIQGTYSPVYEQRMRLYSSHPIQMYSGEESDGSLISMDISSWKTSPTVLDWKDNIWNMWSTKRIIGFSDGTNHTWTGITADQTNRGIIAHCIEHGLKVGDTFEIGGYVGGSAYRNPFTFETNTNTNKRSITVKKILGDNAFLFVYPYTLNDFGPGGGDKGSYWSVIRRQTSEGGMGYVQGDAVTMAFWQHSTGDGKDLRDSQTWINQITTKNTDSSIRSALDGGVQRIEIDGRLMSSGHTRINSIPYTSSSNLSGTFASSDDSRIGIFNWDFGRYFMGTPWTGIDSSESNIAARDHSGTVSDRQARYEKTIDLATYRGGATGTGWAKYGAMNYKPAAMVYTGAETDEDGDQYLDLGATTPSFPAGSVYGVIAEDHHGLITNGPAWIFANLHGDVGLQYLNKGTETERSQVFTMISVGPQYLWGGAKDSAGLAQVVGYDSKHKNYRNALIIRGNDIDQVEPMMPTTDSNWSVHPALSGAGPATRYTDKMQMKFIDAAGQGNLSGGIDWQEVRLPTSGDTRWATAGTPGDADFRVNIPVASLNTTAVTSVPDLTTGAPSNWDTVKLLFPREGEIGIISNLVAPAGGTYVTYTYESFDSATDTFINCRPHKTSHRGFRPDQAAFADSGSPNLRIMIPAVETHCQALFIPPAARQGREVNRVSHAAWMQDIRNSLWFKMTFGRINKEPVGVDGPKRNAVAIRGDVHNRVYVTTLHPFSTAAQHTDYFTLTADHDAGDASITLTPQCAIPMITPDGFDYRYKNSWGYTVNDKNTNPWVSIPSFASNNAPTRKNGGLCFEIYGNDGSLDVGIGDSAVMVNCKDDTDAAFKYWEIVQIREESIIAKHGLLEDYGISDGTSVPGALWLTGAYNPVTYHSGGAFTVTAPTTDPNKYWSTDPATVTNGFANLAIGDVVFLGNTYGHQEMPPTDDTNREWNPNNPTGEPRDLVSYRWYKVLDKTSDDRQICLFPAEIAYYNRDYSFTKSDGSTGYPLKHPVAAHDGILSLPDAIYNDQYTIPARSGNNPLQANLPTGFPTQGNKHCYLYCGDIQVNGIKFTKKRHLSGAIGRFRKIRDDFRHIYILWADMRNDGSADADGSHRKTNFGLVYPTIDNYDISLVHANTQEGIIDLKMGEDIDIWSMQDTDPFTSARWSANRTNLITGDYDYANILHDWEDKAGSFIILDTSKFFNLNTYANNGRIGQNAGGDKDLDGIVVQSEGFPELMDNYWWWSMPHPFTAKYRLPYDPTWKFVCRYNTKVASDVDNGKPILNIDSSHHYQGSYFDDIRIDGAFDFMQYSNDTESGGAATSDFPVGGTWQSQKGCFVTDYDERASGDAKRLYLGVGSRVLGSQETMAFSMDETIPNSNFGMNTLKTVNDHNIFTNWAATHSLPLMMTIEGHIETPASNTYWEHDKIRLMWQKAQQRTWLSGSRIPINYDISDVPISFEFDSTHQGTTDTTLVESYGSVYDGRGQTVRRIISAIQNQSGAGYTNSISSKWHFQIERGRFTYRPSYSSLLTLNRDNLVESNLTSRASKSTNFVRVLFNGGSSFVDYPKGSLNDDTQSSKWKLIDASNVSSASEAHALAVQTYEASKKSSFKVNGRMIRESEQTTLMTGGRHGYILTPCIRTLPSTSTSARSNTLHQHSLTAGCLFPGRVNALDGNLDGLLYLNRVQQHGAANQVSTFGDEWDGLFIGNQSDSEYYSEERGAHGSGTCDAFSVTSSATGASRPVVPSHQSYGWYGLGSVDKAVQVIHVSKDIPFVSNLTGNELRIFITHNSNTANEGKYRIWLVDPTFITPTSTGSQGTDFASMTFSDNVTTKDVQANGYVELTLPSSYGSPVGSRITVSFNKEYCDTLLRYRSHSATASKSNKGNRVNQFFTAINITDYSAGSHSFNAVASVNEGSAFPLGLPEFADGADSYDRGGFWWLHKTRALMQCPSISIVKDILWRPGRTVNYVDDHLDLNEELMVTEVKYALSEAKHESVSLVLQRDDAQSTAQRGFMLPNLGDSYRTRPEPPRPEGGGDGDDTGGGGGSGGGGGTGDGGSGGGWVPPAIFPPKTGVPPMGESYGGMITSPSTGGVIYSPLSDDSGRGNAIGVEGTVYKTEDGETNDARASGTLHSARSQTGAGAPPQDGGYGAGATNTSNRIGISNITKGAYDAIKGKGDLMGEAGFAGQSGLLGVNKNKSSYMHTTESSEMSAVVSSKTCTAGSANITSSGFSLPGRTSFTEGVAMTTFDYHEFAMTLSTPKGTIGTKATVKAKVNAPAKTGDGTTDAKYTLYTKVTCIETGAVIEHQTNFTGTGNTKEITLMPTKSLEGMEVEGNTIEIKVGRTPGSTTMATTVVDTVVTNDDNYGDDNAQFEAIEITGIKIYTEKKKQAPAFKQTTTDKLRMKDNTVGTYSGTQKAFKNVNGEESDTSGVVDRTNEGSNQSSGRGVDGTLKEGDADPFAGLTD